MTKYFLFLIFALHLSVMTAIAQQNDAKQAAESFAKGSGNQKVGDSSVQLILKDCVVFENWTSKLGREGKSFNKYDPANKYWQQYWVADNGSTTLYTGNLQNGEMRYHAEQPMANGGKMMQKLTFSRVAVDKVRQFQQFSTDGGKTWTTGYDFLYVRKSRSTLRTVPSAPDTQQDRSPAALSAGRIPSASI